MSYYQLLIDLGKTSTVDITKYSQSTISSTVSHFQLLKRNNINIENRNELQKVNVLELKNFRGKKIKEEHAYQIAKSIKRVTNIEVKIPNSIKKFRRVGVNHSRLLNIEFLDGIKKIVALAQDYLDKVSTEKYIQSGHLGMYNTCISIMFSLYTAMRIGEIKNLKMQHLQDILQDKDVYIKFKNQSITTPRNFVVSNHLKNLVQTILNHRPIIYDYMNNILVERREIEKEKQLLKDKYVILVSLSYMQKKLKDLGVTARIPAEISLGFNMFRKYTTTALINNGQHLLAQQINNHKNVNTTVDNYYMQSAQATEKVFNKMNKIIETAADKVVVRHQPLTPPPSIFPSTNQTF